MLVSAWPLFRVIFTTATKTVFLSTCLVLTSMAANLASLQAWVVTILLLYNLAADSTSITKALVDLKRAQNLNQTVLKATMLKTRTSSK